MDKIFAHTYYQLRHIFMSDVKDERRGYAQFATACRFAQAQEADWKRYIRSMV